jgi:hypothetical protein
MKQYNKLGNELLVWTMWTVIFSKFTERRALKASGWGGACAGGAQEKLCVRPKI